MRLFVPVLAVLLVVSCQAAQPDSSEEDVQLDGATFQGGQLVGALEKFKDILKHGNQKLNIPILDPFRQAHMNIDLEAKKLFSVKGTLDDTRAVGLSNYKVNKGDFTLAGLKANVSLTWDDISIMTKYNVKGTLVDSISFFGNGNLSAVLKGLTVTVDLKLSVKDKKLYVADLVLHVHVKALPCKITGLFDDEEMSNTVSQIITETAPGILDDYQNQISKYASPKVAELMNNILKNFTLKDLMDLINGK
ncbi:hypothetical protein ANTPLA_LOCUS8704 [Anthophora plagiata]